ncbi:MAG: DUF547 domain-containing protein [Sediminibacterium sp.]
MKKIAITLFAFTLMVSLVSCGIHIKGTPNVPSHAAWTVLVKKYVDEAGLVNYKGFIKDKEALQAYLDMLSANAPADNWTPNDKVAYWLNAYNAFTVKLIVDHYPIESIKDLGPKHQVIFINTPWDIKFFKIGSKTMTLNRIEHRILRHDFSEPRIHFALNCASMSCPKLRREAYEGNKLDAQLSDQARVFLKDKKRNEVSASKPKLSAIFDFYGKDIKKWSGKSLIAYINQYSPVMIKEDAEIEFLDYDWSINEQK